MQTDRTTGHPGYGKTFSEQIGELQLRILEARKRSFLARQTAARQIIGIRYAEHQRLAYLSALHRDATMQSISNRTLAPPLSFRELDERITRIENDINDPSYKNQNQLQRKLPITTLKLQGREPNDSTLSAHQSELLNPVQSERQKDSVNTDQKTMQVQYTRFDHEAESRNHAVFRELGNLTDDLHKLVEQNISVLSTDEENSWHQNQRGKKPRDENEKKLKKIFKRREADMRVKMPLWRHRMLDHTNPPVDSILKGKRLLIAVCWGLVVMYCRPILAIHKRKVQARDRDRLDFANTLKLYAEACSSWMGKIVRTPIISIQSVRTHAQRVPDFA
jgi:hypothetical protein